MEIRYTLHAQEQMKERNIEPAWIEEAARFPHTIVSKKYKFYVTKKLNGKTIKVVFIKEKYIKIITSYFIKWKYATTQKLMHYI